MSRTNARRNSEVIYPKSGFPQRGMRYLGVGGMTHDALRVANNFPTSTPEGVKPSGESTKAYDSSSYEEYLKKQREGEFAPNEHGGAGAPFTPQINLVRLPYVVKYGHPLDVQTEYDKYIRMTYQQDFGDGQSAGVLHFTSQAPWTQSEMGKDLVDEPLWYAETKVSTNQYNAEFYTREELQDLARKQINSGPWKDDPQHPEKAIVFSANEAAMVVGTAWDILVDKYETDWKNKARDVFQWLRNHVSVLGMPLGDMQPTSYANFLNNLYAYEGISGKKEKAPSLSSLKQAANDLIYSVWMRP